VGLGAEWVEWVPFSGIRITNTSRGGQRNAVNDTQRSRHTHTHIHMCPHTQEQIHTFTYTYRKTRLQARGCGGVGLCSTRLVGKCPQWPQYCIRCHMSKYGAAHAPQWPPLGTCSINCCQCFGADNHLSGWGAVVVCTWEDVCGCGVRQDRRGRGLSCSGCQLQLQHCHCCCHEVPAARPSLSLHALFATP
jgi:hypothetical protein